MIISESQLVKLRENIHSSIVKSIKNELDNNYEKVITTQQTDSDFINQPMIKILVNNEITTPQSLANYLQKKYKVSIDFIIQVIRDWMNNSISDDFNLTSNVPLN